MFVQRVGGVVHDDADSVTLPLEVMDTGDIWVVEAGGESGLSLEGFQMLGVGGDGLVDDFDGDDTVQHGVPGTVYRTLSTSSYPLEDFVSADSLEHDCCRGL